MNFINNITFLGINMYSLRDMKVMSLHYKYKIETNLYPGAIKIVHYQIRNWGDDINPIFSSFFTKKRIISLDIDAFNKYVKNKDTDEGVNYLGIGSILHHSNSNTIVWGSGLQAPVKSMQTPKAITAVRGPLTKKALKDINISCPDVFGDPALLLPRFYQPIKQEKKYRLGIISHIKDINSDSFLPYKNDASIKFISMRKCGLELIDDVVECENIISTSLHGLVIADAYQIPVCWIKVSNNIPGKDFKFMDYHESLRIDISQPLKITGMSAKEIISKCLKRPINLDLDLLEKACPYTDS
jgi:pyruvyltransferase